MADPSSILTSAASGAATGTAALPGWGTVIGGAVGLGAGLIGYFVQSGHEDTAREILAEAQKRYGQLTDEAIARAVADTLGPSALASIQQDPMFAKVQKEALASLDEISKSGLNLTDRAALNDAYAQNALATRRVENAANERLSRGHLFGSGAQAAMEQERAQQAQDTNSRNTFNVASLAEQRMLDSVQKKGLLAGQMQQADWGRKSDVARAQDERDHANWGNRQDLYREQAAQAARGYGFAQQNAAAEQGAGQRQGDAIAGGGKAIGSLINSTAANYGAQPPTTTVTAPAPTNGTWDPGKPDPYDLSKWSDR